MKKSMRLIRWLEAWSKSWRRTYLECMIESIREMVYKSSGLMIRNSKVCTLRCSKPWWENRFKWSRMLSSIPRFREAITSNVWRMPRWADSRSKSYLETSWLMRLEECYVRLELIKVLTTEELWILRIYTMMVRLSSGIEHLNMSWTEINKILNFLFHPRKKDTRMPAKVLKMPNKEEINSWAVMVSIIRGART